MKHRTFNRLRAGLSGYFWMACPRCGQMFGGHEGPNGVIHCADGKSRMTCPDCRKEMLSATGYSAEYESGAERLFRARSATVLGDTDGSTA